MSNNIPFMGNQFPSPCMKCEERHEACHDTCEKFLERKKTVDEINKKHREAVQNYYLGISLNPKRNRRK